MEVHLQNSHTCHQCKTMHKDLYELNRHKEKEHGKKRINCTLCHFIANSEQNLKDHMPTHETEKSKCEVCEKMFRSREEIDEHIQTVHVKEMFDHFVKSKKKPVNNGHNLNVTHLRNEEGTDRVFTGVGVVVLLVNHVGLLTRLLDRISPCVDIKRDVSENLPVNLLTMNRGRLFWTEAQDIKTSSDQTKTKKNKKGDGVFAEMF